MAKKTRQGSKIPKSAYIKAIKGSRGIVSHVALKLVIARSSANRRIKSDPELSEALLEERNKMIDVAEATLYQLAIEERQEKSLHYLLQALGKHRGYGKQEQKIEPAQNWTFKIGGSKDGES